MLDLGKVRFRILIYGFNSYGLATETNQGAWDIIPCSFRELLNIKLGIDMLAVESEQSGIHFILTPQPTDVCNNNGVGLTAEELRRVSDWILHEMIYISMMQNESINSPRTSILEWVQSQIAAEN